MYTKVIKLITWYFDYKETNYLT